MCQNQLIIDHLERIRLKHEEEGDENRERAYKRAIESINQHDRKIRSGIEAMELQGIGKGIAWRIDKILGTNTCDQSPPPKRVRKEPREPREPREPKSHVKEPREPREPKEPIKELRVNFVGKGDHTERADRAERAERTVECVERGERVVQSPYRANADKLLAVVREICAQSNAHVALVDEYRRELQSPNNSRLVFLVTEKNQPRSTENVERVIQRIFKFMPNVFSQIVSMRGGCYQALATFRSGYKVSCTFLAIRASEWPFALLKYTGPEGFWQRLQKHAELKGMRLTQQSLTNSGVTELCKTENDIFKSLGLTFIPPSKRY